jgi:hypothetical protein
MQFMLSQSASPHSPVVNQAKKQTPFSGSPLAGRNMLPIQTSSALLQLQDYSSQADLSVVSSSRKSLRSAPSESKLVANRHIKSNGQQSAGKGRLVFDGVEIPIFRGYPPAQQSLRSSGNSMRAEQSQLWTPEPSNREPSRSQSSPAGIEDDYDTWEQGISAHDIERFQDMPSPSFDPKK